MAIRHTLVLLLAALIAPQAVAQQSSGNIMGDGTPGDMVRIERTDIGFVREIPVAKDGTYRLSRVPVGTYVVTVTHADGSKSRPQQVIVQIGTTARVK